MDEGNEPVIYLRVTAKFGPIERNSTQEMVDQKHPIYILSTNQMFPRENVRESINNHFLAVFPSMHIFN